MSDAGYERLSPSGEARRETMLDELVDAMKRTHRARRTRKRAGVTVLTLFVVGLTLRVMFFPGSGISSGPQMTDRDTPRGTHTESLVERYAVRHEALSTQFVSTRPKILDGYRAETQVQIVRLDDNELVAALASIDRPAGLIRIGGTIQLTAAVTDAELGIEHQ